MAAVDDAADTFAPCGGQLLDHQVEVLHEGERRRRCRRRGWQSRRGPRPGGVLSKAVEKIRRQRHVLVKQRRCATELRGGVVSENRANDAAARKCGRRRGRAAGEREPGRGGDKLAVGVASPPTRGPTTW